MPSVSLPHTYTLNRSVAHGDGGSGDGLRSPVPVPLPDPEAQTNLRSPMSPTFVDRAPLARGLPPRSTTFTIPRSITIVEDLPPSAAHDLQLRRRNSVSFVGGPSRIEPSSRMIGEFRTLSIHVTDSLSRPTPPLAPAAAKRDIFGRTKATTTPKDLAQLDWHTLSTPDILQRLNVSADTGLDGEIARKRLARDGANEVKPHKPSVVWKAITYIFGGFGSLLFVAAVLVFVAWRPLGDPNPAPANLALAIVILLVVFIQAFFNAWQDWSTGRVMASISGMLPSDVIALRDGQQVHLAAKDLVVGDIVMLSLGNKLPADVRFVDVASDLKLDRSVLTGESEPVTASTESTDANFLETRNIGLQGTLVVSGSGKGLVIQTGGQTVFGRIAHLSSKGAPSLTTLQREILRFVLIIVTLALSLATLVTVLWGAWLNKDYPGFITSSGAVINFVTVCVAFVPEGLPASVTISLAVVANRLAKCKVLCKSLMTVETLGSVSVICSDKTGTLTRNVMTVTNVSVLDDEHDVVTARDRLVRGMQEEGAEASRQIAAVAGICNAAVFDERTMDQPIGLRAVDGDATDSAILRFAETLRPVKESQEEWTEVFKMNFNSKTKFMLKLLRPATPGSRPAPIGPSEAFNSEDHLLLCKGAPDVLLKRCTHILTPTADTMPLTHDALNRLTRVQEAWAAKGQRVLLLAKRIIPAHLVSTSTSDPGFADIVEAQLNRELTAVGLVGIVDPPRAEIPDTVKTLRRAGIRFFMVTGDFATTAVAIAEQCGIVSDASRIHRLADLDRHLENKEKTRIDVEDERDDHADISVGPPTSLVLSGPDIMEMNDDQWEQTCAYREIVFARTTPEQKLRIVKEFQKRECIVGMTGDGVNDAPSLKAANVGIAMGGGSDVAMEAADLVLLDSFASVVTAVEYGRLTFDNLKKTILYLLPAGSFSELIPILLNVILGLPQALSSIQMIIICVVTDVLPAISMCFERPEAGLLLRKPRNTKKDRLVDWRLLMHAYLFLGVLESLCANAMAFWYLDRSGFRFRDLVLGYGGLPDSYDADAYAEAVNVAQSIYFFTLVGMQWGNLLASRTRKLSIFQANPFNPNGPYWNPWTIPAMLASLGFLFFFSYVPFFQNTFLTRGVPVEHIFIPFAFAIVILFLDEARKYMVRRYPKGILARIAW